MGTGGKPPLAAASPARSMPAGRVARPIDRDAELLELRQRGLAKLLNQHFTETIAKLAAEKAAADAALKDFEARKAATKDFQPSGDGEISGLDAMYISLNQWRSECRRKEKETLMLYQRYVDKFGSTGQIQLPKAPSSGYTGAPSWAKIPESPAVSAKASAPPPNTPPVQVSAMTMEIEKHLEEYLKTGSIALPSLDFMGKEETFQSSHVKGDRRQLEHKVTNAKALGWGPSTGKAEDPGSYLDPVVHTVIESGWNRVAARDDDDDDDESQRDDVLGPLFVDGHLDYDNRSIVSGLTTINSAETRRVLQECEQSVVTFLKEEKEAIRKIMAEEEVSAGSTTSHPSSAVRSVAQQAAEQAESMVKRMNEILEEFMTRDENKVVVDADSKREGSPYETNNPNDKWMMYYDETYQRYYYHETNTNVTRWDPPALDALSTEKSDSESVPLSHSEVMPESHGQDGGYTSRVALYRRKLRRERRRRFLLLAMFVVAIGAWGGYHMYTKYQLHLKEEMRLKEEEAAAAAAEAAAIEAALAEQRAREEETKRVAEAKAEEERVKQQLLQLQLETERLALEAEAEESARRETLEHLETELDRHHWVCGLPLAFAFDKRCRRQAEQKPMFEECNLALAFLAHGRCRNHTPFNLHFDLQSLLLATME